jgi:hypothetical protein
MALKNSQIWYIDGLYFEVVLSTGLTMLYTKVPSKWWKSEDEKMDATLSTWNYLNSMTVRCYPYIL